MDQTTMQAWLGLAELLAVLLICLFLPAWSFRYREAWVVLALFAASTAAITAYLQRHDQDLLRRRLQAGPAAEKQRVQKFIQGVASLAFLGIFLVAGFDYRYGWSAVSLPLIIAGDLLLLAGLGVVFLSFRENSYASAVIETAENQFVVSTGPYAVVRHPMYAGALLLLLGTPLALASFWALLCFPVLATAIFLRLVDEERFLSRSLPGYDEYRAKVRYRLLPLIW